MIKLVWREETRASPCITARGKPNMHGEKEMIDEQRTFEKYGYYSTDLKPVSGKHVVTVCDGCGVIRYPRKADYRDLCGSCSHIGLPRTAEHCRNIAESRRGKKHPAEVLKNMSIGVKKAHADDPTIGKRISIAKKKAFAEDPTLRDRSSIAMKKAYADDPTLVERMSAGHQGIPYEEWTGFVSYGAYCEKFDESCRERIRAKYDHRCFLCSKPQDKNINKNGKMIKLAVHHVDMNKNQGCVGVLWKLVPLCLHCHAITHTKTWTARIEYLLDYAWSI